MSQTIDIESPREVVRKLAEFRNGLDEREQLLIDALVLAGLGAAPEAPDQSDCAALPDEDEAGALVAKVNAFKESLSPQERQLVDVLLMKGSHEGAEVNAHNYLVDFGYGDVSWEPAMYYQCVNQGAVAADFALAPLWYWPTRVHFYCEFGSF